MRQALRHVAIQGKFVIGDGPRGSVPVLYVGETVGAGGVAAEVVVDSLDCITRAARSDPGALSVIAVAGAGGFQPVPSVYMDKIAVGPAAALRGRGGRLLARLAPRNEDERAQIAAASIPDAGRTFTTEDLARGEVIFAAAGVTDGALVEGAHVGTQDAVTHAVVIRSRTGSVRWIKTRHQLDEKGNPRTGN